VIYEYVDYEIGEAIFIDRGDYLQCDREENPTTRALERVIARLENVEETLASNSGMAAISNTLTHSLKSGGKVVVPMELYSSTLVLLNNTYPKFGIKVEKV